MTYCDMLMVVTFIDYDFSRIGDLIILVPYIKNYLKFNLNYIKFKSKLSIF